MSQLSHFPSSSTRTSGNTVFSAFMTGLALTLILGPLLCMIPLIGLVAGPITMVIGVVAMLGCYKSRATDCPHCKTEVALVFPFYLRDSTACRSCKHKLKYEDGRVYDVSAIVAVAPPAAQPSATPPDDKAK